MRKIFLPIAAAVFALSACVQYEKDIVFAKSDNQLIIGNWTSEKDVKWSLVFSTDGTYTQFYENRLVEKGSFSISDTSPQCGEQVFIDHTTSYLSLTDKETNETNCYEIYGLTQEYLNIRPIDMGGFIIFIRKK